MCMDYKEIRLKLGISRKSVCEATGISKSGLSFIETRQREPTEEQRELLLSYYDLTSANTKLEAIFDYFKMSFKITDVKFFIEEVLGLNFDYFYPEEHGAGNYTEMYSYGQVIVMVAYSGANEGILFQLKGEGCRQFETILEEQDRTWQMFFKRCLDYEGSCTRLDIAINDYFEVISLPKLVKRLEKDWYETKFISGYDIRFGGSKSKSKGVTIYFGSTKSELYFCFYQKNYELSSKLSLPIEEIDILNRYEVRFMKKKAKKIIEQLVTQNQLLSLCLGLLNKYLTIYNLNRTTGKLEIANDWLELVGHEPVVELKMEPRDINLNSMKNWIETQCAPTLRVLQLADFYGGTNYLQEMINEAQISPKHKMLIEQLALEQSEIIYEEGNFYFTQEECIERYMLAVEIEMDNLYKFRELDKREYYEFILREQSKSELRFSKCDKKVDYLMFQKICADMKVSLKQRIRMELIKKRELVVWGD